MSSLNDLDQSDSSLDDSSTVENLQPKIDVQTAHKLEQDKISTENKNYDDLQSKYGGISNNLLAAGAGFGRGLVPGGFDLALIKSGLASPQTLKGLKQANPIASNVGELAGSGTLLGATGGAGPLVEGLGSVGKIAGMGLEGAAFGAGNEISDEALGDKDLNAQKILQHAGLGSILGAGLGTLGKASEVVLPKVYQGLSDSLSSLKSFATGTEEESGLIDKIAPSWSDKFKLGVEEAENPQGKIREFSSNLNDLYKTGKKAVNDAYEKMLPENLKDALEPVSPFKAQDNIEDTIYKAKSILEDPDNAKTITPSFKDKLNNTLDNFQSSLTKAESSYDKHELLRNFATDIDKGPISKYYKSTALLNPIDKEIAFSIRDVIRNDLKDPSIWGDEAANHFSTISDAYKDYVPALKDFQSSFMKKVAGPFNTKNYSIDPSKVKSFFSNYSDVSNDLRREQLNNFLNQSEYIANLAENHSSFQDGVDSISQHLEDIAKKHQHLAGLSDVISNSSRTNELPGLLKTAIGGELIGLPKSVMAGIIGASKVYHAISNPFELGKSLGSNFDKLKIASTILDKVNTQIGKGVSEIFASSSVRAIPELTSIKLTDKEYDDHTNKIKQLANNESQLYDHLNETTKNTFDAIPNISSGIHNNIINSISFLNSKIPKPNNQLLLDPKWRPSPDQKASFNEYFQTVSKPLNVLNNIKEGTVSDKQMETLQIVHPQLLQELRNKLAENLHEDNIDKLSYIKKASLSKFMGYPLVSSLLPSVKISNQNVFNQIPSPQNNIPVKSKAKSSKSGLDKIDLSSRYITGPDSRTKVSE